MADAASPASPLQQEVMVLRQRVAVLEAARAAQESRTQALQDAGELAEKVLETIRDPLGVHAPNASTPPGGDFGYRPLCSA